MNETTLVPESGFFRFRVDLSYDGTNFSGWGKQPDRRTVQGEVEAALSQIFDRPIDTTVAGRTDAGVHASHQVIDLDLTRDWKTDTVRDAINAYLKPEPIAILSAEQVDPAFSARIDAPEVVSLSAMISQAERLGSNMVGTFREFTEGIRLNQRQTADERANKASFKMLFPVMLLLLSAMIVLWGPAWLELRNYFRNNSGTVNTNPDVRTRR